MLEIWKFPVSESITMPEHSKYLHIGTQGDTGYLWAMVNPELPERAYKFRIVGTGHPIRDPHMLGYVGTYLVEPFVWHVFAEKP